MDFWIKVLLAAHVVIALGVIGLVLLQHGKGADMGSGFGGGASSSLFGATGSANFLSRTTAVLATAFFLSSLGLGYLATNKPKASGGVMESVKEQPAAPKPATDVPVPKESPVPEGTASKKVPN
jgi:preprotein translocase subunit SecG